MKKIMFDNRYMLTDSVLIGFKTNTRRTEFKHDENAELINLAASGFTPIVEDNKVVVKSSDGVILFSKNTRYKVGEVVAVAQSYKDAGYDIGECDYSGNCMIYAQKSYDSNLIKIVRKAGYANKMYVRADLMPHHIRITGIRVQRLQDISDEDCKAEGVDYVNGYSESYFFGFGIETDKGWIKLGGTLRKAYSSLIDHVSGKGTWESNPFVVAYEFKLID